MSKAESTEERTVTIDSEPSERGIDLFAVAIALISEWRVGLLAFAVVSAICFGYVFSLKPQYVASATLLPQSGRSDSGSLASLFSSHGPGTLYIGLLQSRSVQDDVIHRANLLELFHTNQMEVARDILSGKCKFTETPDTLLTITVRDGDARNAAKIANGFLDALQNLNASMGSQQSTQTAQFFEHQISQERAELSAAEVEFARLQTHTGLVAPDAQTQIGLTAIADARSRISSLRVQLTALLQRETEQNPEVQTLQSQISQLEVQERRLEGGTGESPVGAALPAGQMPQNNLDLLRAGRDVKYHADLVAHLATEFESARLKEALARSAFQVVDLAVVPEHKAWPPRRPYLLASLVFGVLMGMVAIVGKLTWLRIAADPEHRAQLAALRRAFGSR